MSATAARFDCVPPPLGLEASLRRRRDDAISLRLSRHARTRKHAFGVTPKYAEYLLQCPYRSCLTSGCSLRRGSNAFWAPPFVSARFCNYGAEKFHWLVAPNVRKAVPKCVPSPPPLAIIFASRRERQRVRTARAPRAAGNRKTQTPPGRSSARRGRYGHSLRAGNSKGPYRSCPHERRVTENSKPRQGGRPRGADGTDIRFAQRLWYSIDASVDFAHGMIYNALVFSTTEGEMQ